MLTLCSRGPCKFRSSRPLSWATSPMVGSGGLGASRRRTSKRWSSRRKSWMTISTSRLTGKVWPCWTSTKMRKMAHTIPQTTKNWTPSAICINITSSFNATTEWRPRRSTSTVTNTFRNAKRMASLIWMRHARSKLVSTVRLCKILWRKCIYLRSELTMCQWVLTWAIGWSFWCLLLRSLKSAKHSDSCLNHATLSI